MIERTLINIEVPRHVADLFILTMAELGVPRTDLKPNKVCGNQTYLFSLKPEESLREEILGVCKRNSLTYQ